MSSHAYIMAVSQDSDLDLDCRPTFAVWRPTITSVACLLTRWQKVRAMSDGDSFYAAEYFGTPIEWYTDGPDTPATAPELPGESQWRLAPITEIDELIASNMLAEVEVDCPTTLFTASDVFWQCYPKHTSYPRFETAHLVPDAETLEMADGVDAVPEIVISDAWQSIERHLTAAIDRLPPKAAMFLMGRGEFDSFCRDLIANSLCRRFKLEG